MDQFASAFRDADSVVVLDVYAASESPIPGVTGEALAAHINQVGLSPARYVESFAEAAAAMAAVAGVGDIILTLGAGNISQLGPQVLEQLQLRTSVAKAHAD